MLPLRSPVPGGTQPLTDNSCNSQGVAWLTESPAVPEDTQSTLSPVTKTVALCDCMRLEKIPCTRKTGSYFFPATQ